MLCMLLKQKNAIGDIFIYKHEHSKDHPYTRFDKPFPTLQVVSNLYPGISLIMLLHQKDRAYGCVINRSRIIVFLMDKFNPRQIM